MLDLPSRTAKVLALASSSSDAIGTDAQPLMTAASSKPAYRNSGFLVFIQRLLG